MAPDGFGERVIKEKTPAPVSIYADKIDIVEGLESIKENLHEEPPLEITKSLAKVYSSMTEVLVEKNRRYGNSIMEPLGIFSSFVDRDNTESLNGLLIRLDDKLKRIKNSEIIRKNDVSDLLGYLAFLCVEQGWEDFTDLLD